MSRIEQRKTQHTGERCALRTHSPSVSICRGARPGKPLPLVRSAAKEARGVHRCPVLGKPPTSTPPINELALLISPPADISRPPLPSRALPPAMPIPTAAEAPRRMYSAASLARLARFCSRSLSLTSSGTGAKVHRIAPPPPDEEEAHWPQDGFARSQRLLRRLQFVQACLRSAEGEVCKMFELVGAENAVGKTEKADVEAREGVRKGGEFGSMSESESSALNCAAAIAPYGRARAVRQRGV